MRAQAAAGLRCEGIFARGWASKRRIRALFYKARDAFAAGQYELALKLTTESLAYYPNDVFPRGIRAQALMALGRAKDALAQADEILRIDSANQIAMGLRTRALQALGRDDEAIAQARAAVQLEPTNQISAGILAILLYGHRLWFQVIENATRFPESGLARVYGGRALIETGREDVAIALYAGEPPENIAARWGLAEAYFRKGQMGLAAETLKNLWLELSAAEPGEIHPWPLIGLVRIAIEGGQKDAEIKEEPILLITARRFQQSTVDQIVHSAHELKWKYICDRVAPEIADRSMRNAFWSSLYTRPVDQQAARATK